MRKIKNSELNRISVDEYKKVAKSPIVIVLDNIRSLNNIGSFFRTADAFRVKEIHLCGITATPPHRDIHKTALGATESVDWKYFNSVDTSIKSLKAKNYEVFAIEQIENSISLEAFHPKNAQALAFIFGNEVKGVSDSILNSIDGAIEIPQYGTKHSLNVSISGGIVMWEIFRKLNLYNTQ